MKQPKPFNIWVCNRADGHTTLGEYVNAKRHCFADIGIRDKELDLARAITLLENHFARFGRPFQFQGDPLPEDIAKAIPARLLVGAANDGTKNA